MLVRRQPTKGLNLSQVVDLTDHRIYQKWNYVNKKISTNLIDTLEPIFHAFDCMIFPIFHILRFQHLGERSLALLRNKSILSHLSQIIFNAQQ